LFSKQLGYLSADLAEEIAPIMDKGRNVSAVIKHITGKDKSTIGMNITIYF